MARTQPRSRARGLLLRGGLLALLVVLVIAYLGDCIPGLGGGGSSGQPVPAKAEADAEVEVEVEAEREAAPASTPLSVSIEADRCRRDGEPPRPCPELCETLAADPDKARGVVVHATLGTHATVEALETCLAGAGFSDIDVRTD